MYAVVAVFMNAKLKIFNDDKEQAVNMSIWEHKQQMDQIEEKYVKVSVCCSDFVYMWNPLAWITTQFSR